MTTEHLDDDALSAHLDGEATPEEATHVESCAPCRARLEVLRQAASLIGGAVDPVADHQREAAIAAALGASAPVSLDARRRRRQPPPWLLGAAAALIVLAGLVPLLGRAGGGADDDARSAFSKEESAQDADASAGGDAALSAPAPETMATTAAPGLGEIAGQVADRVRSELSSANRAAADDTTMAYAIDCSGPARQAGLGDVRLQVGATYEGRAVQLVVFDVPGSDPPSVRAVLVDPGDCTTVVHEETFTL